MRSANAIKVHRKSGEAERRDLRFHSTRNKCLGQQPKILPILIHQLGLHREPTSERILALEKFPPKDTKPPVGHLTRKSQ
jgi:hypothetical protein